MKKALILEAWFNKPEDNWYPWLKKELTKRGYEVYLPDLPTQNTDSPNLGKQIAFIDKILKIDRYTTVIGHSLGAVLGIRLAERYKFKRLITVAAWDFDDLTPEHKNFWKTKINHKRVRKNVKEIYCIGSDNDPYYTAIAFEDVSKRLGAKFIIIKGKSHFSEKSGGVTRIPQILKYV